MILFVYHDSIKNHKKVGEQTLEQDHPLTIVEKSHLVCQTANKVTNLIKKKKKTTKKKQIKYEQCHHKILLQILSNSLSRNTTGKIYFTTGLTPTSSCIENQLYYKINLSCNNCCN